MRFRAILLIALLLGGGLLFCISGVTADPESSQEARVYCLRDDAPYGLRGPIYVDRNGDGKIDWEVDGPGMMSECISCFKMDTNFDGYYDVKYWICVPITGREKSWSTNIRERVPEIGKSFVRIKRPNWVNWPQPSQGKH